MRDVTGTTVNKMNSGAETMYLASTAFKDAGAKMTDALNKSADISNKLATASNSLSLMTTTLKGVVTDYAAARDSISNVITELKRIVENAKHEASITADVLKRIDEAANKLADAQKDSSTYIDGLPDTITQAHEQFASGMKTVVQSSYSSFLDDLSKATGLLRSIVEDLRETAEIHRRAGGLMLTPIIIKRKSKDEAEKPFWISFPIS